MASELQPLVRATSTPAQSQTLPRLVNGSVFGAGVGGFLTIALLSAMDWRRGVTFTTSNIVIDVIGATFTLTCACIACRGLIQSFQPEQVSSLEPEERERIQNAYRAIFVRILAKVKDMNRKDLEAQKPAEPQIEESTDVPALIFDGLDQLEAGLEQKDKELAKLQESIPSNNNPNDSTDGLPNQDWAARLAKLRRRSGSAASTPRETPVPSPAKVQEEV